MSEHTPGPWQTRFVYRVIQSARKDPTLYMMSKHRSDWADARLMAASPDMLECLKAVEWVYDPEAYDPKGVEIDPAIAGWNCPNCGHFKHAGHAPDCKLAATIRKATEDA